ncbi:group XIIA secretory phospholipase A2 [Macrosteles quadrilineatus]|uniref:group XIIA secretory phospholipase A2 n=1 Tax=Macrosteles quadrilineatus TaxID=74068 RepID=UPI0023E320D0|nr:group XIIA secretory phospholipase A2 [Macrosteles quadrilineatus]
MNIFRIELFLLFFIIYHERNNCNAQILEGLKDAVLNAEGVLGDVFKSLDSVAKHLKFTKEAWEDSVEEECKFACPDGSTPKKNKYYKPTANGCGVPGIQITDAHFMAVGEMTRCCDQHDICYGTCNKDKDECDLYFKKCLYKICDNSKKNIPETALTGCKTAAKVLFSGTMMFGCKFYKSSQQEACFCQASRRIPAADEF